LYLNVHVVTDQTFLQFQGLDLAVWDTDPAEDPGAPRHYRLLKTTSIREFTKIIGKDTNQDPETLRIWVMVNRQNKTVRPDQPLTALDMTVEDAFARYGTRPAGFRVWAESTDKMEDGKAVWPDTIPQPNNNNYIMLLLKYFDAEGQTLKGAGHIYVKKHEKVQDLAGPILQLMGWSPGVALRLYEASCQC
jgi:ubiquitin carboxyl-terminal hydrolase 7